MNDVSGGVAPSGESRWSRVHTMSSAALASLLYLLLLDAAVETFLGGSSLRWIVGGSVAAYVALTVLLWRRLSWATKAWVSFFVLLALLALAAWRLPGANSALVALRQPTSTLLAGATALAVLLAGWILVRLLKFLPWPARVAIALLTAYGIAAFVVGVVADTPYAELLRGKSLWQRAPFWLQGAFIGAVVLVPAALLAQLVTSVSRIRAGQLRDWGRQVVALALSVAITVGTIATPDGSVTAQAAQIYSTPAPQPPPNPTVGKTPPATYEEALDRFRRLQSMTQALVGLIDPSTVDVVAKAYQLGANVDSIFAFVRNSIRFEPYSGVLRGARGALMAGSANALDRSLLLAHLLAAQGYNVRIVPGSLAEKDVETLMQSWEKADPHVASMPTGKISQIVREAGESEILEWAESARSYGTAMHNWITQRSTSDAASIRDVVGSQARWFTDTMDKHIREQTTSHFWVQVEQNSNWVDLDPSFPTARIGQRLAVPGEAFDPSKPPQELLHKVAIRVTAEYIAGENRSEQVVLDATIATKDLVAQQMYLTNEPVDVRAPDDFSRASKFRAVLQVGKERHEGTDYVIGASQPAAGPGGLPDVGGELAGGEATAPVLSGLWLDVTLSGPGMQSFSEKRYLLDRIGFARRAQGKRGPLVEIAAQRLPYLLTRNYDILVMSVPYSEILTGWLASQFLVENQEIYRLALDVRYGKVGTEALSSALAKPSRLSFPLVGFASAASEQLRAVEGDARLVLGRPLVVMYKQGFHAQSTLRAPLEGIATEEGFDIVCPGAVPVGGDARQRAALGIAYGTFLTNLELAYVRQLEGEDTSGILNASSAIEAARKRGQRLVALRRAGEELGVSASPDVQARIRSDLEAGHVVVTVRGDFQAESSGQAVWWRLDPISGVVLGLAGEGEGQATVEDALRRKYTTENWKILLNFSGAVVCGVWSAKKVEATKGADSVENWLRFAFGQYTCYEAGFLTIMMTAGGPVLLGFLGLALVVEGKVAGVV